MASEATIKTVIVDDEAPARTRIRQLLKGELDFEIVAECANGREAVERIISEKPDVVFLDVQMPRLNGLEVCEAICSAPAQPLIIFVTAYDEHALKAFELHAIDYLLKPFDRERFLMALKHARDQLRRATGLSAVRRLEALLEELRPGVRKEDRLVFKENGRVIFVRAESIDWVEADGNYVRLHAGSETHYVRGTLAKLEAQLPPANFMRISRSAVVNLERVKELQPLFYGDYIVVLQNGSRLNMSRNYRDRVESLLARRA